MKKTYLLIILIQTILFISCQKDDVDLKLCEFIRAGQKSGVGIKYKDLDPDINCTIIDPWEDTDTLIYLDLNRDGTNDFCFNGSMCHPSALGGHCESLFIIPLHNNEICIRPMTNWLDTIPCNDTINIECNWSNDDALIYSYYWIMGEPATEEGCWKIVTTEDKYYIGCKIINDHKSFYGWIGMKRDTSSWSFNYVITDYGILKEYAE